MSPAPVALLVYTIPRLLTVYVKLLVVGCPTRSRALRTTLWFEPSGEAGTRSPGCAARPSTVAEHEAMPEPVSAQRNARGTRPFSGTVAPGWSSVTVGGRVSTGASSVASKPLEPRMPSLCRPSSSIVIGPSNVVNAPPSIETATATPGTASTSSTAPGVNQPAVCVPPGAGSSEGTTPVPVGGGGAPAKRTPLLEDTATLPAASTAWTKYSTRVPPTDALPPHVGPAPCWRSRNRHAGETLSRNATSTRTTPAGSGPGRSTASRENDAIPDAGGTVASIASRRGAR